MRRDAKLGLALGMLVLGLACAFCFPRQRESAIWTRLETPVPIADSELEFLPIRAYQPAPAPATAAAQRSLSEVLKQPPLAAIPAPPPPAPIAPLVTASPVSLSAPTIPEPTPDVAAPVDPDTLPQSYRVRPGDTLSGISIKTLGTSRRYLEIFEANRDQMGSPDSLKVGMELQIPPRRKPPAAPRSAS